MPSIKMKKLAANAVIPKLQATRGAAGYDLTATSISEEMWGCRPIYRYHTGIAVELPPKHMGLLFPRSSIYKTSLTLANCVGVIDSDYRGEIIFVFERKDTERPVYKVGDRVGQLVILPFPSYTIEEVDELSDTARGAGGFGSTGN